MIWCRNASVDLLAVAGSRAAEAPLRTIYPVQTAQYTLKILAIISSLEWANDEASGWQRVSCGTRQRGVTVELKPGGCDSLGLTTSRKAVSTD